MPDVRIATFNVENLGPQLPPGRVPVMRDALCRARADVLCLEEVLPESGTPGSLSGLTSVIAGTPYEDYDVVCTQQDDGDPLPGQNLVVLTTLEVLERHQYLNAKVPPPTYLPVTADPRPEAPMEIRPDRPILHVVLDAHGSRLHLLVVHLKSRIPVRIPGQLVKSGNVEVWRTAAGWAEGSLLSSMRRVTQALELRRVIDDIFAQEPEALILAVGDFNSDIDDVPLAAIRGAVEDNDNASLAPFVMVPCELPASDPSRFSLYHHGRGLMYDHVLASRGLLARYRGTEIHNELVHDESVAFATDAKYPESDHAPVIATFSLAGDDDALVGVAVGSQRSSWGQRPR